LVASSSPKHSKDGAELLPKIRLSRLIRAFPWFGKKPARVDFQCACLLEISTHFNAVFVKL